MAHAGTLAGEYADRADGDMREAAALLAFDLMAGDEATFKAGYTFANALLAASEVFALQQTGQAIAAEKLHALLQR